MKKVASVARLLAISVLGTSPTFAQEDGGSQDEAAAYFAENDSEWEKFLAAMSSSDNKTAREIGQAAGMTSSEIDELLGDSALLASLIQARHDNGASW